MKVQINTFCNSNNSFNIERMRMRPHNKDRSHYKTEARILIRFFSCQKQKSNFGSSSKWLNGNVWASILEPYGEVQRSFWSTWSKEMRSVRITWLRWQRIIPWPWRIYRHRIPHHSAKKLKVQTTKKTFDTVLHKDLRE